MFWGPLGPCLKHTGMRGLKKKHIILENEKTSCYCTYCYNFVRKEEMVAKKRTYHIKFAKNHEKVAVRTVCTGNPIRNSTTRNDGVQTSLEVSRQLLTGQKKANF